MSVIERKTKETDIKAELNVYGSSKAEIDSGIGFFDHMLTALTVHGGFDLKIKCDEIGRASCRERVSSPV